jgi:hypothetical protein
MLEFLLGGVVGIVGAVVGLAARQPKNFKMSRSLLIKATPDQIFPHINNLQNFNVWNPWAELDPTSRSVFEGATEGVGAAMHWVGNGQVGEGRMTCTVSQPYELIQFRMDFMKPMQATNIAEFTLQARGDGTLVTWSMSGTNSLFGKIVHLVMNCDDMVGGQFDKGLKNLAGVVEK